MKKFKLFDEIVNLSDSEDWDYAKLEWHLEGFDRADRNNPETCLCGKPHIIDVCILRNSKNNQSARVGNVCVKKFMNLPSDKILACFKRIQKDPENALNAETIKHAHVNGWLRGDDKKFINSTNRKRKNNLTDKQLEWRTDINKRIIANLSADISSASLFC